MSFSMVLVIKENSCKGVAGGLNGGINSILFELSGQFEKVLVTDLRILVSYG